MLIYTPFPNICRDTYTPQDHSSEIVPLTGVARETLWPDAMAINIRSSFKVLTNLYIHDYLHRVLSQALGEYWALRHLRGYEYVPLSMYSDAQNKCTFLI